MSTVLSISTFGLVAFLFRVRALSNRPACITWIRLALPHGRGRHVAPPLKAVPVSWEGPEWLGVTSSLTSRPLFGIPVGLAMIVAEHGDSQQVVRSQVQFRRQLGGSLGKPGATSGSRRICT